VWGGLSESERAVIYEEQASARASRSSRPAQAS